MGAFGTSRMLPIIRLNDDATEEYAVSKLHPHEQDCMC